MWDNKNKAITFSFDDGVTQDIRLIEIMNKYGLRGTFNLNSERFEEPTLGSRFRISAALICCGGKAKITLYENDDHNCWDSTYSNDQVFEWLLTNKKEK